MCPFIFLLLSVSYAMIKVAVGIIFQQQSVLLCQRKPTARYALKWEFHGGKLEQNESPEECLRRELHEELGISAAIGGLFHQQHYLYKDSGSFDVLYFLVRDFTGELINNVFASVTWVPLSEISSYDILEGNHEVVRKLVEQYAEARS